MTATLDRLELSRLLHRFGFGPRPGDFARLLAAGIPLARKELLTVPAVDRGAQSISEPVLTDLGPFPRQNTVERNTFDFAKTHQHSDLIFWWLDRMVLSTNGLTERATWFWHGHWATSIDKVNYPLPMFNQNRTLREYALGNFSAMARAMVTDGALLYWLDGGQNTKSSPNENLARELMELFTLGVGNYSESDVRALARALTGWKVEHSSGRTSFSSNKHDESIITILGKSGTFDAISSVDFLTSQVACQTFISSRVWFRFINANKEPAGDLRNSFQSRNIIELIYATATHSAMRDPDNSQVKAPVEWFASVCRALSITPSQLKLRSQAESLLKNLSQLPFDPPNVGGWPADEAWLSAASTQFRLTLAQYLVAQGDLSPLQVGNPVDALANWLGVAGWSPRTFAALKSAEGNLKNLALLAICSPEYVVSA
jgi:uncharacterized protein (DUF1800 family)